MGVKIDYTMKIKRERQELKKGLIVNVIEDSLTDY
jgi:hypothetical protein